MTRKQSILRMIQRLPEDVTYDQVMYHLDVMKAVEVGTEQIERGEGIEHEKVFRELLANECLESNSIGHPKQQKTSTDSSGISPRKVTRKGHARS